MTKKDKPFRPMLAAEVQADKIVFPCFVSPKLDGIRAVVKDGILLSRTLKPIPNHYLQSVYGRAEFDGLDGELVCQNDLDPGAFQTTVSQVMSIDGCPSVRFVVFDDHSRPELPFIQREENLYSRVATINSTLKDSGAHKIEMVPYTLVSTLLQWQVMEALYVGSGYEGIMMRSTKGLYKYGRSTVKEQWLLKYKRFEDGEAVVVGFVPKYENHNEAVVNSLGLKERSTKKAGRVAVAMLGAFVVRDCQTGVEFELGTGYTDDQRRTFWEDQGDYLDKIVKYRYQPTGVKTKPRFPSFQGFRPLIDFGQPLISD